MRCRWRLEMGAASELEIMKRRGYLEHLNGDRKVRLNLT
jgi:hypothetical protein